MLDSLYIKNIALIKELNISFRPGFTVFTGETGAGKSIIIDSIGLILGKPVKREIIRTGEETALVSGVFTELDDDKLEPFKEAGFSPDEDGSFMFSKEITRSARNMSRINTRPVPAGTSRELIGAIMTIHGQNENQALFDSANHIKILDSYAKNDAVLERYSMLYSKIRELDAEIKKLQQNDAEKLRRADMLRFQSNEIRSAHVKQGEESELLEKKKLLLASEKIIKSARIVYRALYSNEKGVSAVDLLSKARLSVQNLASFFSDLSECSAEIDDIISRLTDIAERARDVAPDEEENPTEALDRIESRLDTLEKLHKKYGATENDIFLYLEEITKELSYIENSELLIEELTHEKEKYTHEALTVAEELSSLRRKSADTLSENVSDVLRFLDMPSVCFSVSLEREEILKKDGLDKVEFLLSPNPGESLLPMSRIASGGELSRIMLALKSVLAESDRIPTVIFDEIDAGISGKTSRKVGIKLKELSKKTQIICVTHSAQIASLADTHVKISKKQVGERTETELNVLTHDERVAELARILGSIEITKSQRETAAELIAEGLTL